MHSTNNQKKVIIIDDNHIDVGGVRYKADSGYFGTTRCAQCQLLVQSGLACLLAKCNARSRADFQNVIFIREV